jgi:hypothetical protein
VGLKQAAVAGTLIDGNHFISRHALQFVEIERELAIGSVPPGCGIDTGDVGQVVAHEERIVWRDRCAKVFQRCLILRRTIGQLYERFLARKRIQDSLRSRSFRQCRREIEARGLGLEKLREARPRRGKRGTCACHSKQATPCNHARFLLCHAADRG